MSVGAFVGFLAVGDSRLWGFEFEAEVLILATFFKVGSTNAFCYIKAILLGHVAKENKGAGSQNRAAAAARARAAFSAVACRRILLRPQMGREATAEGTGSHLVLVAVGDGLLLGVKQEPVNAEAGTALPGGGGCPHLNWFYRFTLRLSFAFFYSWPWLLGHWLL